MLSTAEYARDGATIAHALIYRTANQPCNVCADGEAILDNMNYFNCGEPCQSCSSIRLIIASALNTLAQDAPHDLNTLDILASYDVPESQTVFPLTVSAYDPWARLLGQFYIEPTSPTAQDDGLDDLPF